MSLRIVQTLFRTVLKPNLRILINQKNGKTILCVPTYVMKHNFSAGPPPKKKPSAQVTSVITTKLPMKYTSESEKEEMGEKEAQEASWRTMKYTLVMLGITCICTSAYLLVEFGKPEVDADGEPITDEYSDMPQALQYIFRTLRELNYYKRLIKEPSREKLLPDELKLPYYQPAYTLVLELTDVLVHPDWTYQTGWRFKKRPGIDYFLETLSGSYEIVIYTAEQGMTVFPIIEALDPKNLIMYKLVRDATHFVDGEHVKNLDKLNRNLNKVIVVDWNADSVRFHPDNVFQMSRWSGNDDDTALIDLTAFLMTVASSQVKDVRDVLRYYNKFPNPLAEFREKQRRLLEQMESQENARPQESELLKEWTNKFFKPSNQTL